MISTHYCYVVVNVADGKSRSLTRKNGDPANTDVLGTLLEAGWRPVRETVIAGHGATGWD